MWYIICRLTMGGSEWLCHEPYEGLYWSNTRPPQVFDIATAKYINKIWNGEIVRLSPDTTWKG